VISDSAEQFRELILHKGRELRELSYDTLLALVDTPEERVELSGRLGTIALIVEACHDDRVRIVVQGFLARRLIPFAKSVCLDGFYKHRNGTVTQMDDKEFYDYD
jgi:hypothetical protein